MTDYVEGWEVLAPGSKLLHPWVLRDKADKVIRTITLRNGSAGFLLAHVALGFHELVESLEQPAERGGSIDDGGYSYRPITGGTGWSKHAAAVAMDLNWRLHVYGARTLASFTHAQVDLIHHRLLAVYDGVIEWGGDWPSHPGSTAHTDSMHFQINSDSRMPAAEKAARSLIDSPRGKRILAANPGQLAVIKS